MPFDMKEMLSPIDFTVETRPIYDSFGNKIDPDIARGAFRTDTDECLSVVGKNWRPVQHMDVMSPVVEYLEGSGFDVQSRPINANSLYDIKGKSGALVSSQVEDNGAVMRTDVIFGNFIEAKPRDTMFYRVSILNSHNMKYAVRASTSYLRLLCFNGMVTPQYTVATSGKHTSSFNLDGMLAKIENGFSLIGDEENQYREWARTPLSLEKAREFIEATLARLPAEKGKKINDRTLDSSKNLVNKILGFYATEDQTVFGLWNAMTYWSTHDEMRSNSGQISGRVNREMRVARALRSNEFESLC